MPKLPLHWLLPVALAAAVAAAQAQTPPRAAAPQAATPPAFKHQGGARPDPLDVAAAVPALVYRSTLASYRRLGDEQALPWREANQTVARIGGWRAYTREAAAQIESENSAAAAAPAALPAPAPASAASAPPRPMPTTGHGHHKMH